VFIPSNDSVSSIQTSSYSGAKSLVLETAQLEGVTIAGGIMLLFFCMVGFCYNIRRTKRKYKDEAMDAWMAINNGEAGILYSPVKKWVISARKSTEYSPNLLSYESKEIGVTPVDDAVRSSSQISLVFSDSWDDHDVDDEDDEDDDDKDLEEVVIRTPRPSMNSKLRSSSSNNFEFSNKKLSSKDGESFFSVI